MRLAVITINFNGSQSTVGLIKSLARQTDKDFEIIVIDNASEEADFNHLEEGIENVIQQDSERVFLLRNEKNSGFSGGNNIGIKKALNLPAGGGVDWVILLNNDTWVEEGFIASLKAKLGQSEGIVGIPLNEGDYTAYCGKLEWLKPTLRHIYNPVYSEVLVRNSGYYAIGGAMAIHKDVLRKIGLMDEKYFLYFEDADISLRAKKAGFKLAFLEEPKVRHQVSSTTKKLGSPLLLRYHYRNSLYFNFKNGPGHIKFFVWPWSLWVAVKQLLKIMMMCCCIGSWC